MRDHELSRAAAVAVVQCIREASLHDPVELHLSPESAHAVADVMETSRTDWMEVVAGGIRDVAEIVDAADAVEVVVIEVPGDVALSLERELSAGIERIDVLNEIGSATIH